MSINKIVLSNLKENNSLLIYCIDELLSIINRQKLVYILDVVDDLYFTMELFDNDSLFYTGILKNYENYYRKKEGFIKKKIRLSSKNGHKKYIYLFELFKIFNKR